MMRKTSRSDGRSREEPPGASRGRHSQEAAGQPQASTVAENRGPRSWQDSLAPAWGPSVPPCTGLPPSRPPAEQGCGQNPPGSPAEPAGLPPSTGVPRGGDGCARPPRGPVSRPACPDATQAPAAARSPRQRPRQETPSPALRRSRAVDLAPVQAAPLPPRVIRARGSHPQPRMSSILFPYNNSY